MNETLGKDPGPVEAIIPYSWLGNILRSAKEKLESGIMPPETALTVSSVRSEVQVNMFSVLFSTGKCVCGGEVGTSVSVCWSFSVMENCYLEENEMN